MPVLQTLREEILNSLIPSHQFEFLCPAHGTGAERLQVDGAAHGSNVTV